MHDPPVRRRGIYLERAIACDQMAAKSDNLKKREVLLNLSEFWLELADQDDTRRAQEIKAQ